MIKVLLKVIAITLVLSSCTSIVDQTIPLTSEFEGNSKIITLVSPNWKASDSIYNKVLDDYSIENTTTWKKEEKRSLGRKREVNLINHVLLKGPRSFLSEEIEIDKTEVFSFDLVKNNSTISTTKCEIFSQSVAKETIAIETKKTNKKFNSNHNRRLKTYLICEINYYNQRWELILKSYREKEMELQLKSDNQSYEVSELSQIINLVKDGNLIEKRNSPAWISFRSGLEFFQNKEQVAALSFVGKPKIWLKNELPRDSKEMLLAVNYSLIMFNWLDREWR